MLSVSQTELLKNGSLLGLIFDQVEFDIVLPELKVVSFSAGQTLVEEGAPCDSMYICLSGELELYSHIDGQKITNGNLQPGRSFNLYAVLTSRPYQYAARFKTDGQICKIPTALIRQKLDRHPYLQTYLLGMTQDHDIRSLAKELDSIGCSQNFRVQFISSLVTKTYAPHEWLMSPRELASDAFYLLEGQLVHQHSKEKHAGGGISQWQAPARTWIGWKSLAEGSLVKHLLKSTSVVKALSLNRENFLRLKSKFPKDIGLYSKSILSGFDRSQSADDEPEEEVDIDAIIKNSKIPKRKPWASYPFVQQNDQMDCGPACMAMVSEFYDHRLTIQYWRNQLSTNREGTSFFDLAQTAERCGFTAYALAVSDLDTLDKGFFPAIALRQYHYLVIYKVTAKSVIVGDPGLGIVKMTKEEFYSGFENSVLFLKPTEKFFSIQTSESQYAHFWGMLSGLESEIALNFFVSVMIVGLGLFSPLLSQIFMDDILVRRDLDLLKLALAGGGLIAILGGLLSWSRVYYANYLATKFDFKAHSIFMKKMLSLDYKFFSDRHVGDFTKRLHEMEKIKSFLINSVEKIILSFLSVIIYSVALFMYSPTVALTVFAVTPVFFVISWFSGKKLTSLYQVIFKEGSELDSNLTDTIKGIATVKALGSELASRWRYEEKFIKLLKAERNYTLTSSTIGVLAEFYSQFANYVIMGLSAFMAIKGQLSPGQVVAVTMISGNVLAPLTSLAGQVGSLFEMKSVFNRLNDILLAPSENTTSKGRVKKEKIRGEIEFRDVWFRYGGESSDWVLKGISFKIEAGQNIAFVGPSGSGKSTLAGLLNRMYIPTKGQIFIDGRDYLDYDVNWLRQNMGVLQQESHLFRGSILENIALSEPEVNVTLAIEAAKKAAADEFIQKKPGGYDYLISAGGFGLSGGEKQRLSLARTFYKNPKILILDEATSALDGIAEFKLLSNIKREAKEVTIISIAHRYSTVKYSDFALVLFEGRVVGFGRHEDLKTENEIYKQLFSLQTEAQLAEAGLREVS
jgi:ATP-binding cassette, subfamily B, bacterial HlyB/CyaB